MGGRLTGVTANQGPLPSFTLVFENEKEERGTLTFQPNLLVSAGAGVAEVKAQININIGDWRK